MGKERMTDKCRFEMRIKGTAMFQCAAERIGWAHLWEHGDFDPCLKCEKKISGKPLQIDNELKSAEFWPLAGKQIRTKDWQEWERRGVRP